MSAAMNAQVLEALIGQLGELTGCEAFVCDAGSGQCLWGTLPAAEQVHPEDRAGWRAMLAKGVKRPQPFRVPDAGGAWRWEEVASRVVVADGRRLCVGGIVDVTARREEALRASEAELRGIIETTPFWVTRQTPDGRYTFVNRAYCHYMGMSPEALCAADYRDRVWLEPADFASLLAERATLSPARPSVTVLLATRHPDGTRRIEEWTETALFGGRGELLGYQSVGRDVTETQRMERDLRASEARYRAVVDTQTEWIVRQTPDCRNSFVNEAYRRYMGMTDVELTAASFDDLAPLSPEDRAQVLRNRSTMTPERPSAEIEFRVEHTDGTVRWEHWIETAIFDATGQVVEYQAVGRDITDRVEVELALRASEERYRAVVDAQTELVTRVRPDGRATFVNDAYCRYMGMAREQLLDPAWDDLSMLAPDRRAALTDAWARLTPEQPLFLHETEVLLPDGRRRIEVWNQRGIFDGEGRLLEVQGVGRDVSEQRQMEQALRDSEERYRNVVEAQTEWVTRQTLDGRFTFVNDAYCRYMGMSREALLDPAWDDLAALSPAERVAVNAAWAALRPDAPDLAIEVHPVMPDGRQTTEAWTGRGIFDEAGRLVEVQGVGRDVTEQRRIERALRDSEAQLRAIVQTQTEWLTRQGPDGRYSFVNEAYCRYMGMSREQLTAPDYDDFAHVEPEDREHYFRSRAACTPARPSFSIVLRVHHVDGSLRFEDWSETTLYDELGMVIGYQAVGRDVTEQRQAADALRASEAAMRETAEGVPLPLTIAAADRPEILFCNEAAADVFGYAPGAGPDVVLRVWADPAEGMRFPELVDRHAGRGFEVRLRRRDGSLMWALVNARRMVYRGRAAFLSVMTDITERRRIELALVESEQRFRRFAEAHPVPLCALRMEDWRVLFVNPAYLDLFQLTWDELDGADKRGQWADPARRAPYYERVRRDGMTHNVEVELRRKDGSTFPAALSSRIMELGGVKAVVNSVVDLGPQRAAEAMIAQQREALHQSEKMGALGSLLAGVAHELNNPLSVVVGYASLLKADARGRKLREQAERIHTAAERCARIVKTFLAMARQKPPSFGPVDMARTAQAALELAGYALRTSGIEIRLELPEDLPLVHGDADQLHQVMANLVINAQQALQDRDGPRRVEVVGRVVEGHVVLEVRDNGPGMPEEIVRRIFEPFYTTKPAGLGTGLGLSVCHGIVTAHGGRIAVASRPGDGTTVTIALPVVGGTAAPPSPRAMEMPAAGGGRQILVVDDEFEIADLVAGVLRRDGHRVVQAADGAEALRRLDADRFDLVVSDLRMPGVDGSSLLRSLRRSHPVLAGSAVVLTGDLLSASRDPELQGGTIMLLEKPVDLEELRRVVRVRLAGRGR